jgi:hypothetical protein
MPVLAGERLRVDPGNVDEAEIKDCLKVAERAANDEDLDACTSCFCLRLQNPMRRRLGLLFVQHLSDEEFRTGILAIVASVIAASS